jgi:uncharacterized membrane protein
MGRDHPPQHDSSSRDKKGSSATRPLVLVLATIYLVFAVALANTAFVAMQGRSAAAHSLESSTHSLQAFSELKQQITQLRQELVAAQQGLASSSNQSSSQVQQQLAQLKQELQQPLLNTSRAAASLLDRASRMGDDLSALQHQVDTVSSKLAAPSPPPAGAHVEDKELHHIVKHAAVCNKNGASGLQLNATPQLVAPVVVVAHARAGYLAKTMVALLRCGVGGCYGVGCRTGNAPRRVLT